MDDTGIIERSLRESVYCETGDCPNMWVSTADCATTLIKKLFEKYVEDDETLIITSEFEHENVREIVSSYRNVFKLNVEDIDECKLNRLISHLKTNKPKKVFVYLIGTRVTSGIVTSQFIFESIKKILEKYNIQKTMVIDACQEIYPIRDYSLFDHIIFTAHSALMYFDLGILYSKNNPKFECDWMSFSNYVAMKKGLIDNNSEVLLFNSRMRNIFSESLIEFGNAEIYNSAPWFFSFNVEHTKLRFTKSIYDSLRNVGVRLVGTESIDEQLKKYGEAYYQVKMRAQHYVIHPEQLSKAIEMIKCLLVYSK